MPDQRATEENGQEAEPGGGSVEAGGGSVEASGGSVEAGAGPVFSVYGVVSALLGLLCVAAVTLTLLIWSAHRERADDLGYQTRVAQAAIDWTGVLINLNKDNVDTSLAKLRDGTVGDLNKEFEAAMQPFREVMVRLQSRSQGQINSVSIESLHHKPESAPGAAPDEAAPNLASRTDTVLIAATSVSENAADPSKPQTVHWNLRVGVSEVEGKLRISRLEWIR